MKQQPKTIDIDSCVSFFRHLHDSGLAATTINTLKSALTVPIKYGFNILWNQEPFENISKSCAKLRPNPRPKPINWSLPKVLEAASDIGVECSDVNVQLKKTAFLISLASAGRISKITALKRGDDSIQFLASGDVRLTPDELFLAINESSDDRWESGSIPPLPEYPPLCLVTALR